MAETNDVQALQNISTEVDESQIKIILSSQCIKAQAFLFNKLRKQSERQREICNFIRSSNLKMETEIQLAEQEIVSLNLAIDTIKNGNIELKKEYLLSKDRKKEIFERTENGKKKYENLWLTSKTKYDSIPCIRKLNEAKNQNHSIQLNINSLICETEDLMKNIEIKKKELDDADRKLVIELANFFVHERPKTIQSINAKQIKLMELSKEVEKLSQKPHGSKHKSHLDQSTSNQQELQTVQTVNEFHEDDNWSNLNNYIDKDSLTLPKLQLQNDDLDILSVKLNQIKKDDLQKVLPMKRTVSFTPSESENNILKKSKTEENPNKCYFSSYYNIAINIHPGNDNERLESKKYSNKKLIHILEDIKLDQKEAYEIMKAIESSQFQEQRYISPKIVDQPDKLIDSQNKMNKSIEIVEIEEIDLTTKSQNQVVAPPSPFLDASQNTQENKAVTSNINEDKIIPMPEEQKVEEIELNRSEDKIYNISSSPKSYATMKDIVLKKHNLNLSPQHVYAKYTLTQEQNEDKTVASKFFQNKDNVDSQRDGNENGNNQSTSQDKIVKYGETEQNAIINGNDTNVANSVASSSPKLDNSEASVAGVLFNHGPQGIPDSLNLSISTTGFDDIEDFPHCIDSSILLSPNRDIPTINVQSSGNNEVLSQEVPNFLAGFRKAGLSFFGCPTTSDSKPDSSAQNQSSSFKFTFGNEEKKGRGGFFSIFH